MRHAIQPGDTGRKRGPDGAWIMCCWDTCDRAARMEYTRQFRQDTGPNPPLYPFCSERHAELHSNSPRNQHQLPSGSRGLLAPR